MAEESRPEPAEGQSQANDEKAVYEIGFHVIPTLAESEALAVFDRIKAALAEAEVTFIAEAAPKKTPFAYRIERSVQGKREKYTEGHFGFMRFEGPGSAIPAMEAMLQSDYEVLRYLLIHTTRESGKQEQRAVFSSTRLDGEAIVKPVAEERERVEVSQEELDKSLKTLVGE